MKESGMSIIFAIVCIGVLVAAYGMGICVKEIRFHRARIGNKVVVETDGANTEPIAVIVENDQPAERPDNTMTLSNGPTADHINVEVKEDISTSITLMGSDPQGSPLIYRVVHAPRHGRLSNVVANVTGANLTYTPNSNYTGLDSFTYRVNNGGQDSDSATVTLTVLAANDPPTPNQKSVATKVDKAVALSR
jgi:hypothetical protein